MLLKINIKANTKQEVLSNLLNALGKLLDGIENSHTSSVTGYYDFTTIHQEELKYEKKNS